ncbi:DNA-binding transcriptional regulator, LysR family [Marinobacter sp. es.048]|uniref:LysR substrate-binding domain-containing protein n=1 Tax=Marinobacter sp. es.048 TaxID=1761795 RepID=UPI000B58EA9E|nr:LysR substrate-binding domain-containing protein [Marinobacter sp. es.048]SNC66011.1 DNA-binding transcriptional regulator, LysR family [Marinobacter sp. es.048]
MNKLKRLPPIHAISAFESVARLGSFTAAAGELNLGQSAISKQIKTLEEQTKAPLFMRHARGVELTNAGKELLNSVQPALHQLSTGIEQVRQRHDAHTVTVIATHAVAHYWLFPRVIAFNRIHPEITVSIRSDNAIDASKVAEFDFGILYGEGDWPLLDTQPLFTEFVYPVCHPELNLREPRQPEDLVHMPLIELDSTEWDCIGWHDWFRSFGVEYQPAENSLNFNQVTLAYEAARRGLGVALGWHFMVKEDLRSNTLKRVGSFVFESGKKDYLVHNTHLPLKASANEFREWLLTSV